MSEWFKEAVLKTVVSLARDRGFESYSLRHFNSGAGEAGETIQVAEEYGPFRRAGTK